MLNEFFGNALNYCLNGALNLCDAMLAKISPVSGEIYKKAISARKGEASFLVIDETYYSPSSLFPEQVTYKSHLSYVTQTSPPVYESDIREEPSVCRRTVMNLRGRPFKRFFDVEAANNRFAPSQAGAPTPQ